MPHILVAGKLHPSGVALLKSAPGFTFDYVEEVSEPSYAPLIDKADALVIRTQPLSAATLARASKLQVVSRHGVGYDAVHLPSLVERGIVLTVVGDVNSLSVAEHSMMLILSTLKQTLRADRAVRSGQWAWRNRLQAQEAAGKNLLILGYGRIGRHVARLAEAFGMKVRAFDPYLLQQGWPAGSVAPAPELLDGLAWADAVSINLPKVDRPLLGAREFAVMKPTAILVNTARGGIIEDDALIAALSTGQLAGAGLDVFDEEPPPPDSPLLSLDNVVLTPHIAALTAECAERMALQSVQNVLDFFDGSLDASLVINRAAWLAAKVGSKVS
jgi:D-3-phosphoglycerate dehydrogenase / 2-oxoglutarate reductase